jgi:GH35 family endo-1,4-beta-xylanase
MAQAAFGCSSLNKLESSWQLIVDGNPYLILGAELQNSSMSSARYMETVWQEIVDMGVNTVLGAVAWEDIEPEEGVFDFAEFDAILTSARNHNLRLIITWFGSFKNGIHTLINPIKSVLQSG